MKRFINQKLPAKKYTIAVGGRLPGNTYRQLLSMAVRLREDRTVFVLGCKSPRETIKRLKSIGVENVIATPVFNGMGRKLGEMTMPEDDTPTGYRFDILG